MNAIVCLLIDDDAEESEIFHYALEEMGFPVKCHTAKSGKEALSLLNHNQVKPDYIFLDMNMPRMNGKQCLMEIKKIPAGQNVPVILYSTFFPEGQKEELAALGAHSFIIKTASVFDLHAELFEFFTADKEKQNRQAVA